MKSYGSSKVKAKPEWHKPRMKQMHKQMMAAERHKLRPGTAKQGAKRGR